MTTKCLEIYHWRDAVKSNALGELTMDESVVARHVTASASDPEKQERILALMMKYRDPSGVYAEGGCIDATRESIRLMHPLSSDIRIPEVDLIK
jgi:hypothetical protein